MDIKDFRLNDRVQLHPATDAWMRGDRFGTVVAVGRVLLRVNMDRSQRTLSLLPANIVEVV